MQKTPVLIVGGGPVGLGLACELGWRGIACTLVRHALTASPNQTVAQAERNASDR